MVSREQHRPPLASIAVGFAAGLSAFVGGGRRLLWTLFVGEGRGFFSLAKEKTDLIYSERVHGVGGRGLLFLELVGLFLCDRKSD